MYVNFDLAQQPVVTIEPALFSPSPDQHQVHFRQPDDSPEQGGDVVMKGTLDQLEALAGTLTAYVADVRKLAVEAASQAGGA